MEETEDITIKKQSKLFIPNENIYKTHILDENGEVSHVFVFCAGLRSPEHMSDIFSEIEIAYYRDKDVHVVFSEQLLNKDDSIRDIKHKIVNELLELNKKNKQFSLSIEELYLFTSQQRFLDMEQLYQEITEDDTKKLTKERFFQYATNISADPYVLDNGDADKGGLMNDVFTYDQWMQLSKSGTKEIFVPIGMEFQDHYDFMYPSNPYKNQLWTEPVRYQISSQNNLLTFDKSVLLNYGNNKNIMVCLARNVFAYGKTMNTKIDYMCQLYFPFLSKLGVTDETTFEETAIQLHDDTNNRNNKKTKRRFEVAQLYREIYWSRVEGEELPYLEKGIKKFFLTILANNAIKNLPLEHVFRNIHSNKNVPFIKYNPGSRKENMYRLFSDNISLDGKKIPLLDESVIMKLSRETGKNKQISLYVQDKFNLYVHIHSNSEIKIEGVLNSPISSDELNKELQEILAPIFNDLNNILHSLGYNMRGFENLQSDNVIFSEYTYQFVLPLSVKMSLQNQLDYITPMFDVLSTDVSKGAKMRFKRVRNYKEMDAKSIIIREIYDRTGSSESVIQGLMDNYDMSEEEAMIAFSEFRSQHQLLKQKIVENPGFGTLFQMKPLKNELVVEISDISSTSYISALITYIDVILRLSQKPKTITILSSKLKKFKTKMRESKKTEIEEEDLETVVAVKDNVVELYKPVEEKEEEEMNEEVEQGEGLFFDEDIDYYQDYEEEEEGTKENTSALEEEDDEFYGGKDTPEEFKANIDGMPIKNPSPFFKRMMELDPTLFVTEESSKFPLYSKACPSGDKRQPVIITDEEKKRIDETNPGSYGHALLHGSSEDKKNWYICPRYWCLKTNSSISEEDVKAGKCGNIIPRGADRVPPGAYVYEFNNPKNHMKDGKYVQHVPGFLKKDKHPDGLCVPCCFGKSWDSKDQVKRRQDCDHLEDGEKKEIKIRKNKKKGVVEDQPIQTNKTLSYIISSVSYPLPQKRWGFLPLAVQLFFKTDSSNAVDPKNAALIRSGEKCLLRYGVEKSENQSFLSCFAYFYAYKQNLDEIPSLEQMRTIFTDNINLDLFVKYHNGNLVSIFKPKKVHLISSNINSYKNTDIYKTIDINDETQVEHLEETIASYENFLKFVQDENSFIDHTYLWDFFCDRNNNLMGDGLNLIILQLSDDDITERVQLICPSNAYSGIEYDNTKETVILLKQSNFYEPIHLYQQTESIVVSKTNETIYVLQRGDYISNNNVFNINNKLAYKMKQGETRSNTTVFKKTFLETTVLNEVKEILRLIKVTRKKYCAPLPSMPKKYNFKRNLQLLDIMRILKMHHYQIEGQVLNYRNKVIGVRVRKEEEQPLLFVPCFPSAMIKELKTNYMDDIEIWLDYRQTRNRLGGLTTETNGQLFTKPIVKIMEDGLIVGLLTETNQFVQVNPPAQPENDNIPEIKHNSYSYVKDGDYKSAEKVLTTEKDSSFDRIEVIRNIHLETQFFNIFRTMLRIQLNNYENRELRKKILAVIDDAYISYRAKLKKVKELLNELMKHHIEFKTMDGKTMKNMEKIVLCDCKEKETSPEYCLVTEEGKCMTLFPKNNLITNGENEKIYYDRISDELIRYNRTKLFMFHPKTYMNISNIDFHIDEDELFLLESKLTREYFRDLVPYGSNNYVNYISYDNAQPDEYNKNVQNYSNKITMEDQMKILDKSKESDKQNITLQDFIIDCIEHTKPNVIGGNQPGSWRMKFPSNAKELFFNKTINCSFIPIIYIFQQVYFSTISVKNIKTALWKGYSELFDKLNAKDKVISILRKQGKINLMNMVKTSQTTFETILKSDEYYITDLDWWVFCTTARLPVIMFSATSLKTTLNSINWLKLGGRNQKGEKYFFVRYPSDNKNNVPLSYHVVESGYSFSEMKDDMFVQAERGDAKYSLNMQTLEDFISRFTVITKLKK